MDRNNYDQDMTSWDDSPFIEDMVSPRRPPAPASAPEEEFPWFSNQTPSRSARSASGPDRGRTPPRSGSQPRNQGGRAYDDRAYQGRGYQDRAYDNRRYYDDRAYYDDRPYYDDGPYYDDRPYEDRPYSGQGGRKPPKTPPPKAPRNPPRRKRSSPIKAILLILLLGLLAAAVAGALYFHHLMGKINFEPGQEGDVQVQNIKPVSRTTSILLVGEDARLEGETGQRSDSMILCTLNPETDEVILSSFMRDMYVPIPGYGKNRINTAFSRGGIELLEQTIEEDFGVQIDGYVRIDFGGFLEAVAALGDMQMELTEEEAAYMNAHPEYGSEIDWTTEQWDLQPGWNTLTPSQFLCYARMRHVGNSDWERTERQRKVLTTCYQQVKNCGVTKLLSLLDAVAPYITTDIRTSDLLSYAYMLTGDGVSNIESVQIPVDGTYQMKNIKGMEVLVPDLAQNAAILQEYFNNTRSNNETVTQDETGESGHMAVAESAS